MCVRFPWLHRWWWQSKDEAATGADAPGETGALEQHLADLEEESDIIRKRLKEVRD